MTETPDQPTTPAPPPPQPGYQPGPTTPPPAPPVPMTANDERTWSLLAHIGTIVLGFLAPLIVMLVKGPESATVRAHAVESLNFQITLLIAYVASWVLAFVLIGFFLLFVVWVVAMVFAIIATIAASKGEPYKYPFALRLVN